MMKNNLVNLRQLLLALLLLLCVATPTFASAQQEQHECADELEMMIEAVEATAFEIGIEAEDLFTALAHGLSCAQVAIAHQSRPGDLIAALTSYEDAWILDMLLEGELEREEASTWREENWIDATWFIHEEDPFGLSDTMWLLDAACEVADLDLLELLEWMEQGESIASIAQEMEADLEDIGEAALRLLEMEIDQLLVLEEVDEADAEEWLEWMSEELESLLHDDELLDNLADEIWLDEAITELAELLDLDGDELWTALEEGESIEQLIEDAGIELEALFEEFGAEELEELINFLNEEEDSDGFEDEFDEAEERQDF